MEFDPDTEEFLDALDPATQKIYRSGLAAFLNFYKPQGTIKDFLDLVEEDMHRSRRQKTRIARKTLKDFVVWLQERPYKPKTIRTYITAIQSEGRYFEIPISTRYVNIPASKPVSSKFPWTIDDILKFVDMIKKLEYKSMAVTIFQTGLSISDLLALTYQDIKFEFEQGISPLCFDLSRIKTDVPFMTFLGEWGISLLKQHLTGKNLNLEDPLYSKTPRAIDRYFERLARKFVGEYNANNPCRPHSLRAAFRTLLSDQKVDPLYIEFWMGHQVPEQKGVYISKSRDGWRQTYREQAEPWLSPQGLGQKFLREKERKRIEIT